MPNEKYTFRYESGGRTVEISFTPEGDTHHEVTLAYLDFLRGVGYIIPIIDNTDICDLATD